MVSKKRVSIKKRKDYILKDKELRVKIIQLHYDVLAIGHRESWKTIGVNNKNLLMARNNKRYRKISSM